MVESFIDENGEPAIRFVGTEAVELGKQLQSLLKERESTLDVAAATLEAAETRMRGTQKVVNALFCILGALGLMLFYKSF